MSRVALLLRCGLPWALFESLECSVSALSSSWNSVFLPWAISISSVAPQHLFSVRPHGVLTTAREVHFSAKDLRGLCCRFLELLLCVVPFLPFIHLNSTKLQCLSPKFRDMLLSIWTLSPCFATWKYLQSENLAIVGLIHVFLFSSCIPHDLLLSFETTASYIVSVFIVYCLMFKG